MDPTPLATSLERQRGRDVLGRDPVASLIAHSAGFGAVWDDLAPPSRLVDLGSGGGVPGLVLAAQVWPEAEVVLVDASQRRCTYLELEIAALGLGHRVQVRWGRAEELGHDAELRGSFDVVTARSFGPPAVTAECAAPLLRPGGVVIVSEPPGSDGSRWPAEGLALVGLALEDVAAHGGSSYARLRQVEACPPDLPRRPGLPERRPLF